MPDPGHSKGDNICAYTWSIWKHSTNSRSSCVISFRVHDHTTKFPSLLYPVIISELKETSRLTNPIPSFYRKRNKSKERQSHLYKMAHLAWGRNKIKKPQINAILTPKPVISPKSDLGDPNHRTAMRRGLCPGKEDSLWNESWGSGFVQLLCGDTEDWMRKILKLLREYMKVDKVRATEFQHRVLLILGSLF